MSDKTKGMKKAAGRLALRHEGQWWMAYYAEPDTMEGAIEIGRIRFSVVQEEKYKEAFQSMMREVVADLLEDIVGKRPTMLTQLARESERSGHS